MGKLPSVDEDGVFSSKAKVQPLDGPCSEILYTNTELFQNTSQIYVT